MNKECGICTFKVSCGYSALRRGKVTDNCCEPHSFQKAKNNFWSPKNQRLESLEEIAEEEKDCIDHSWFFASFESQLTPERK
jgi:hypothetical protein